MTREVVWVNIHGGEIWRYAPGRGETRVQRLPERVGAVGLATAGTFVLGLASGFALYDPATEVIVRLGDVEADRPTTRLNDGRIDRHGRFVCGGMDEAADEAAISAVYRLDTDGSVHEIIAGIRCANSTCFGLDGTSMYFSDMPTGRILRYRYDARGTPDRPRVFADLATQPGLPDGSTIDAEGCLWNAQWGGARLVRYRPDGRIDRIVALPVTNPTSLAFGDSDFGTLFVTSARFGLSESQLAREPLAGSLLAVRPGVSGVPEPVFGGDVRRLLQGRPVPPDVGLGEQRVAR